MSKFDGSNTKPKTAFSESERQLINNYLQHSGKSKLSSIMSQIKAQTPKPTTSSKTFPVNNCRSTASKYTQESPFKAYEIADDGSENKENKPNKENIPQSACQPQYVKVGKVLAELTPNKPSAGEEMKAIVKKIFMFYASFGDRLNSDYLKANKVHKLMHDAVILDNDQLDKTSIDLLFCRYNKNKPNMPFGIFLSMLVNISQIKYPDQDAKQAFTKLFDMHLKPLYESLCAETEVGDHEKLFKEPLDQVMIDVLNQVRPTLQKIHQVYFPFEYQIKSENSEHQQLLKHKTDNCLSSFLKDFEICPKILTNSTAYALYVEVLETDPSLLAHNPEISVITEHDAGNKFTLARFLVYIARLALVGGSKSGSNENGNEVMQQSNSEKLLGLLETLELSAGYVNFEKQLNLTHNHTTRLLPNKSSLKRVNFRVISLFSNLFVELQQLTQGVGEPIERVSLENQQSRIRRTPSELSFINKIGIRSPQATNAIRSLSFASPQHASFGNRFSVMRPTSNEGVCNEIFERKRNFLYKLFQDYASTNGNANNYKLKSIKFLKMLKNADLLQENTNGHSQHASGIRTNGRTTPLNHHAKQSSWGGNQMPRTSNPAAKIEDLKRDISTTDFDLIFIKVSGNNKEMLQKSGSELNFDVLKSPFTSPKLNSDESRLLLSHGKFLDYSQFLKALEAIAEKLYPEFSLDAAVSYIIEAHLSRASANVNVTTEAKANGSTGIKRLVSLLNDNQIVILSLSLLKVYS